MRFFLVNHSGSGSMVIYRLLDSLGGPDDLPVANRELTGASIAIGGEHYSALAVARATSHSSPFLDAEAIETGLGRTFRQATTTRRLPGEPPVVQPVGHFEQPRS